MHHDPLLHPPFLVRLAVPLFVVCCGWTAPLASAGRVVMSRRVLSAVTAKYEVAASSCCCRAAVQRLAAAAPCGWFCAASLLRLSTYGT